MFFVAMTCLSLMSGLAKKKTPTEQHIRPDDEMCKNLEIYISNVIIKINDQLIRIYRPMSCDA